MLGQWEVVVRPKREKGSMNGKAKPVVEENKKTETIVKPTRKTPLEVPSIFSTSDDEDEKKTKNEKQAKKSNPKKSAQNQKPEEKKSPEVKKVKQPKTVEQALSLIDPSEIHAVYVANVGGTGVSRLLDVARFLNSKITADQNDETYSNCLLDYPFRAVPLALKNELQKVIDEASNNNVQLFLELCLSSIANNMIKGLPATGYKIFIQLVANTNSNYFPKCNTKIVNLMSSYQNRPPIGLSLLWAIGQGGLKDIKIGLQVWRELMVPMIDMKHYVKYVVTYLIDLLKAHISNADNTNKLSNDEVIGILDFINTKKKGMPKELEGLLNNQACVLRKLYFEKSDAWNNSDVLEQLLKRLPSTYTGRKQLNDIKTKEMVFCFVEGLRKKESNYKLWRDLQRTYVTQTTYILLFIESNWSTIYPTLHAKQIFNAVSHFKTVYEGLQRSNKDDEGIKAALKSLQNMSKKTVKSRSIFWILGSLFLVPVIAGLLLTLDVQTSGSFEKSRTGQLLDKVGAREICQVAWSRSLATTAKGYMWAEKNAPYYYSATVEFSKPYAELAKGMSLIVANQAVQLYGNVRDYVVDKWPAVHATIDQYVPGFLNAVQSYSAIVWNAVKGFSCQCFEVTSTFLMTKVFVDNWAPAILQAKTLQALNSTQLYAAEYYGWFHKQVDHYSKIH